MTYRAEKAVPFMPHKFDTKMKIGFRPRVCLTAQAYADIYSIVDQSDQEVSWFGIVDKVDDVFIIKEVFVLKQKCSDTTTEIDKSALIALTSWLVKERGVDEANKLQFWGHSHVEMTVDPSFTDEDQVKKYSGQKSEFFVRCIANKRGQMSFSVYYFNHGLEISDVPWGVIATPDEATTNKWKGVLKTMVKKERTYCYKNYRDQSWKAPRGGFSCGRMDYGYEDYTEEWDEKSRKMVKKNRGEEEISIEQRDNIDG